MEYLSPTYSINNVSLNLLDSAVPLSHFASTWVTGIMGVPAQITNSLGLSGQLAPTLPGGLEWFLDVFVRGPWPGY
jgi:hypothetical protein